MQLKWKKCGYSALIVANELFKIYDESKRTDLEFLRDKNTNIFLQAVWKKKNFLKDKSNKITRNIPLKNSYYLRTKLKSILYLISPRLYIVFHNIIKKLNKKGRSK